MNRQTQLLWSFGLSSFSFYLVFYNNAIKRRSKAILPIQVVAQSFKVQYYLFPDHVKLLVKVKVKVKFTL
jgi:hypothetical protein